MPPVARLAVEPRTMPTTLLALFCTACNARLPHRLHSLALHLRPEQGLRRTPERDGDGSLWACERCGTLACAAPESAAR